MVQALHCLSVTNGNLDDFFRHENQAYPPSLSNLGKLRQGNKADLLSCLENCTESISSQPNAEVANLDGAVAVNFLKPVAAKTFENYAVKVFYHANYNMSVE